MTNEEIVTKLTEHDVRLDKVEKNVSDLSVLTQSVSVIAHDIGYIKTDLSEVKAEVKSGQAELKTGQDELRSKVAVIENAPDKTKSRILDSFVEKVVWAIVGGALAFVLYSIAPNVFGR
jgi:chromosome segregation ATPase